MGKRKKIEFNYINEYAEKVCMRPEPASAYVPKWYKNLSLTTNPDGGNDVRINPHNRSSTAGPKRCIPLLDPMITGYIVPLWSDIYVNPIGPDGIHDIQWQTGMPVVTRHGNPARQVIPPYGFSATAYKYESYLRVYLPKGYSLLITQPFGYRDSPIHAIPAIIDAETKGGVQLNFPFWMRENFSGIIEKGHPMVQLIPFKRDRWESTFSMTPELEYNAEIEKNFATVITGGYRKYVWKKKEFK